MKNRKYTFRVSILTLFGILTFVISVFLIASFYTRGIISANKTITSKNAEVTKNIIDNITSSLQRISSQLAVLSGSNRDANVLRSKEISSKIMWEQLKNNSYIASIFMGDEKGDFLQVRRTPALAVREIRMSGKKGVDIWKSKDENYNTISVKSFPATYDARTRSWYKNANENGTLYWTEPYVFASTHEIGITAALPTINPFGKKIKVVAADFTLDSINKILKEYGEVMDEDLLMFSNKKEVIAASFDYSAKSYAGKLIFIDDLASTKIKNLYNQMEQGRFNGEVKDKDGVVFIYSIFPFKLISGKHLYLATLVKKSKVIGDLKQTLYLTIFFSLIMICIISVVIWILLNKWVIDPLQELKQITESVAKHDFDSVKHVNSQIIEFNNLSISLVTMARSIKQYQEDQKNLMDSFIKLIADAIDSKSPYTGGHCARVPEIAIMLAKTVSDSDDTIFKDFTLKDDDEWREFKIAAWLHDCGKVTTPEYVVDKATKLETIYNRIHEIRARFEILYRDAIIQYYVELSKDPQNKEKLQVKLDEVHAKLKEDFEFIAECNIGSEFMSEEKMDRLKKIADTTWEEHFNNRLGLSEAEKNRLSKAEEETSPSTKKLLEDRSDHLIKRARDINLEKYKKYGFKVDIPEYAYNYGELYNLCISKGTLTHEERFKINEHIIMTIKMLEELPFTDNLKRIPEYAGTHHETMDGSGYPRQLTRDEISIPGRIMAIADIFEALTASDRPYKKAKKLSEAIKIMGQMKNNQQIDPDIFDIFLKNGIFKIYAEKFLPLNQIDNVDINDYLK